MNSPTADSPHQSISSVCTPTQATEQSMKLGGKDSYVPDALHITFRGRLRAHVMIIVQASRASHEPAHMDTSLFFSNPHTGRRAEQDMSTGELGFSPYPCQDGCKAYLYHTYPKCFPGMVSLAEPAHHGTLLHLFCVLHRPQTRAAHIDRRVCF
jgi:hypothetical protein